MRATLAGDRILGQFITLLLILCFSFHISLVAKIFFAYLLSDKFVYVLSRYLYSTQFSGMSGEDGEPVDPRRPNHDPDDQEQHHHSINPW